MASGELEIDDVLTYALFPQVGLKFLENRGNPDFFEPVPTGNESNTVHAENGDEVYLSSGSDGELTEYRIMEDFGASQTNVSFGRYQKSTGAYNFVPMDHNTPSWENAYPKIGPVVISEIMYHPTDPCAGDPLESSRKQVLHLHQRNNASV